jgi:YbbR-like protein
MPKIKQLLLNNIELKIFSVILAVLIWYIILGQEITETMFFVPIEFQNVPKSLEIIGEYRKAVEITLKGPSAFLTRMSPHDVKVLLDLTTAVSGEKSFYANDLNIDVPLGLTITKINPPSMKMVFDIIARKEVPIQPVLQGKVAYGYQLTTVGVKPRSILVEGGKKIISALQHVNTDPINVEGIKQDQTVSVSISSESSDIRLIDASNVSISLQVKEIYIDKVLEKVSVTVADKSKVRSYSPSTIDVILKLPLRLEHSINVSSLYGRLDVENLAKGKHVIPITILIPPEYKDYTKITSINPTTAIVNIK